MSTLSTTNLKNPSSGSNNIVLATDGSATIATLSSTTITGTTIQGTIKSGTAVASTSGTSIDFTSIPSWVKRVTVMFNGVSTNGTSIIQIQIGSGSISASGYASTASYSNAAGAFTYATSGFIADTTNTALAAALRSGFLQLVLVGSNTWIASGNISGGSVGQVTNCCAGNSPALSSTLDRVRITTVNGTDTFDAGSINILYEG
jgi:hypothetical protein